MAATILGSERATAIVIAAVAVYLVGLAGFYPANTINLDEVYYLEMAFAFAGGSPCLAEVDALSGVSHCEPSGQFLPGMSLTMAPFVALFGWRGGYLVPGLAVAVATLGTAAWLRAAGRSPLFALLVLGYPPTLVLGRVAMSDVPSTALVALGLWLFWIGGAGRRGRWLASGFVAGLSISLRETNALLFAPFYLGSLVRRESGVGALIIGGIAGSLLRPLGTAIVFGDPLYVFPAAPTFGLAHWVANLPSYAVALLVFVPGGLIAALLYRGERWPELIATVVIFLMLYLSFGHFAERSGWLKGLVLGPRYFAPLTPLLAFAAAEVVPRLWARWSARPGAGPWLGRLGGVGVGLWMVGVFVLAFAIHPAAALLSGSAVEIREAIYDHSPPGSVLVIDHVSSNKHANALFGDRQLVDLRKLTADNLAALLERHGAITVALLERHDSSYWRERAAGNGEVLARLMAMAAFEPLYEWGGAPGEHLRIWRVRPQSGDQGPELGAADELPTLRDPQKSRSK